MLSEDYYILKSTGLHTLKKVNFMVYEFYLTLKKT